MRVQRLLMFFFHVLIVEARIGPSCKIPCIGHRQLWKSFLRHSTFFCYRTLSGLELLSRSGWLAIEPQESTCVCLTCAGIISTRHRLAKRQRGFWDLNSACKHPHITLSPLKRCLRTRPIHLVSHV